VTIKRLFKSVYRTVVNFDPEARQLLRFVARFGGNPAHSCRVLDVGCGYGRNLRNLMGAGYQALGVDVNPDIVAANQQNGLNCVTASAFMADERMFDVLVMSHVIEHFPPLELKDFMDSYLGHLKVGGHLIIATPLLSKFFYEDFDHVKPYHPDGISMVFGEDQSAQTQYYSKHKLALRDIWFRKSYFKMKFSRLRYSQSSLAVHGLQALDFFSALVWMMSGTRVGFLSGWLGVFERTR
jgi:SAM-dependent methyltransferase